MTPEEFALYFLQDYYNIPTHWETYKILCNSLKENQQLKEEKQELIDYLKEKIEISKGNDTVINGLYFKSMSRSIYEEILSKIEKE